VVVDVVVDCWILLAQHVELERGDAALLSQPVGVEPSASASASASASLSFPGAFVPIGTKSGSGVPGRPRVLWPPLPAA